MTSGWYLTNDKAVIMIAHRLKTVQKGIHEELVRQDGIYRHFIVERREATKWRV